MLFSEFDRCLYQRSPLIEVICQIRFPTILSISAKEPAEFQEVIRHDFPQYAARQEQPAPRVAAVENGVPKVAQQPAVTNYHFVSQDNRWKVNLTNSFIALSTLRYTRWEEFAQKLDKVLADFIQIYKPDFFERVGLRYVNAVSKEALGLSDLLWDDLIQSPYLGILGEPDVDEADVTKCTVDVETRLKDGCRLKLHAGPGLLNGPRKDPQPRFILDMDLSSTGKLTVEQLPIQLEALHRHSGGLFHGAITDELHNALGPVAAD